MRKELELCSMRMSQLQTRLVATLDELDASRTTHQRELKTERRAKEKLSEKLDRYVDEIRRTEAERDEMREVVSLLVDKGVSPHVGHQQDVQSCRQSKVNSHLYESS